MWKCLVEEVYELLDAIANDNPSDILEETGDVLFQLLFIVDIYREKGSFDVDDCIEKIARKMIRRHPHIYKNASCSSEAELYSRWDAIKELEKTEAGKEKPASVLDSVPSGMPALLKSYKVSERAGRFGLDWDGMAGVIAKVEEEWQEFNHALNTGNKADIASEFGDVLFTLSNVARFAGIHPETALAKSTDKFEKRFRYMEKELAREGIDIDSLSSEEIDSWWDLAKKAV